MDTRPNEASISITSETAPLIRPISATSDHDLFMVPLKRPSPRVPSSRYRNVKPKTPPLSPAARTFLRRDSNMNDQADAPLASPLPKPDSPPMFASPIMSPQAERDFMASRSPPIGASAGVTGMAPSTTLAYHSPPLGTNDKTTTATPAPKSTPPRPSREPSADDSSSARQKSNNNSTHSSPRVGSNEGEHPPTAASSVYDTPAPDTKPTTTTAPAIAAPAVPPMSTARRQARDLGLTLRDRKEENNHLLAPPVDQNWTVCDSPMERLSQIRATPDSAYDRARQMEIGRSEWKRDVYRFPVKGKGHWVIDCDLTESSHDRLSEVARRSSEGFEWNGDYDVANIYRVLSVVHRKLADEMRTERQAGVRRVKV